MANENFEINIEEFNAKMENVKNEEEEAALLQEYGLCVPGTEANDAELSEEQLGDVTGGARWRVGRPGVPVFDRLPGGTFSSPQRIVRVHNQSDMILGRLVRDSRGFQWVQLPSGGFVNATHLNWVSGSVNDMNP